MLSIMRKHQSKNSYNSRLTRWFYQHSQFNFEIKHLPGTKRSLVYYISREPKQTAPNLTQYDEEFLVATLDLVKRSVKR